MLEASGQKHNRCGVGVARSPVPSGVSLTILVSTVTTAEQRAIPQGDRTPGAATDTARTESEDNKLSSMSVRGGGRVLSLPGSEATIRGFSGATLIVEDEASRVDDALYFSIRPMLAVKQGRLILMSTPFGKRGHFWNEWDTGTTWQKIEVPATSVPRISQAFLDEEKASMGSWWFEQEYLCQFKESTDSVFSYDDVMGALSDDVPVLFGGKL